MPNGHINTCINWMKKMHLKALHFQQEKQKYDKNMHCLPIINPRLHNEVL